MDKIKSVKLHRSSPLGISDLLSKKIIQNWLLDLRETNPAILDMYRERNLLPYREIEMFSGEFAGKYMTGAYYIYQLTKDQNLYDVSIRFLDEFLTTQDPDGYLGIFCEKSHLTGGISQHPEYTGAWDAWAHYHIMLAYFLWFRETGKPEYLAVVEKAADLFIRLFYNPETGNKPLHAIGATEMNMVPVHVFSLLYRETGKQKYLDFALNIVKDFESDGCGDYIRQILSNGEFYQCAKPRWESLHSIIGIADLYRATKDPVYLAASEKIFRSILKTDVHNDGAFSTDEQAVGTPFKKGPIETCCVIAYNALGVEIYKLTGDNRIVDFLELSHYNACMALWSLSGRWSTYDTPMDGLRFANTTSIQFQSRAGSPELNCCSTNAARAVGMMSEWAVNEQPDGRLILQAYEAAEYETENGAVIRISGNYPFDSKVKIHISGGNGKIAFRIPEWSKQTEFFYQQTAIPVVAGSYANLDYTEEADVEIHFDFAPRYLKGELDFEGKTSVFRGPILFACDTPHAGGDLFAMRQLTKKEIAEAELVPFKDHVEMPLAGGITLCNFAYAGQNGSFYISWLNVAE